MATGRLPTHRLAGIVAWTAASVAWGTTLVTMANTQTETSVDEVAGALEVQPVVEDALINAPMPSMPANGLVVFRYTPVDKPVPETLTVTRRVVRSGGQGTAAAPTTTKSSGS